MRIVVTGGCGFIGSAVVRYLLRSTEHIVLNIDKLSYSSSTESTAGVAKNTRYQFARLDITEYEPLWRLFSEFRPHAVMHLAAESHVDRSIDSPRPFMHSNIIGTFELLEVARRYFSELDVAGRADFRFHHVSTDEVYGELGEQGRFVESTPYAPSSPYSASKAASDHLVRAWHRTYGLPVLITNCSNNFGPYQYPEKLIPTIILSALRGRPLPIYGDGKQVRDWLFVEDHAEALYRVLTHGRPGETYNIGGNSERRNINVVERICELLDLCAIEKPAGVGRYSDLITFVPDRPGHDRRYAIDASKIERELGWSPRHTFETGLNKTVHWYLSNLSWCDDVTAGQMPDARFGLSCS